MNSFWNQKRVLVTGGHGFLGSHLIKQLEQLSVPYIRNPLKSEFDLRKKSVCQEMTKNIDIVIHLSANVGGIGYNLEYPGTLFYDNLLMGVHLMEEARKSHVSKFVALGTICAYPKYASIPFKEEDLWNGYPEETNAPYGLAKKMLLVQAQAYRKQYRFNAIYLLPVNLYGPRDNFNPQSSHVIPALIRKFVEAKHSKVSEVVVWGTGKATREFLYVEDAAQAIVLATEKYDGDDPVNIGAGFEISIYDLAHQVAKIVGFNGKILFDATKPDGQPRRSLDVSKAEKYFGFKAKTKFENGLEKTIRWYEKTIYVDSNNNQNRY